MGSRDEQFASFVTERSGHLLLVARAVCGDAQLAEDIVQTALVKAYLAWGRLSVDQDPYGYVRQIVVRTNIDRLRRRRFGEVSFEAAGLEPAVDDPEQWAQVQAVNDLLAGLSPRERAVVVLRHLEDLSETETAVQLGIPLGTVKSTCSRALAKMRTQGGVQ